MSETISISVPRDAVLLRLASDFYRQAAEHVEANPVPELRVLHQKVGDVEVTVAGNADNTEELQDAIAAVSGPQVFMGMPEAEAERTSAREIDETYHADPAPVDVGKAFAPKSSMFEAPPEYEMTSAAGVYTREQYHESGWTDDALLEAGYMVKKVPAAPVAAAPTPSPAPMAPAPITRTAPAPTPVPPTSGGTASVDSEGTPWDARIHASTKTTMKSDGTWKLKKGVDKGYVEQVKAELRLLRGNTPVPKPAPVAAPSAGPVPTSAPVTVGSALMKRLTSAIREKQITNEDILRAVRSPQVGLEAVADLCKQGNELLCATVEQLLFPEG
jgi:hypothetical protein